MYHEPFGPHGAEEEHSDFWTDIPEGSDMMPGVMPGMMPGVMPGMMPGGVPGMMADDLYPTGHHAVQQDEYGTGIDPHGPDTNGPAMPGDAPEQMPEIRAQAGDDAQGQNGAADVVGNFEPGSEERLGVQDDLPEAQDTEYAGDDLTDGQDGDLLR